MRAQIDENLKKVYQEALDQELPDTLTALLDRLRAQEAEESAAEEEEGDADEADPSSQTGGGGASRRGGVGA